MDIKILVVTHKKCFMPTGRLYLPIQVGKGEDIQEGIIRDNTGDNIADKNANYCELTAMYWAWKNLNADYIGLAHYRRHFSCKKKGDKWNSVLNDAEAQELCKENNVILPRKRNYFIETNYSQYVHAHHAEDLDKTREILAEKYPAYLPAYDASMKRTSGHRFNMFIMSKKLFNQYCSWLFDILFTLEQRLDISCYNSNDARVYGFVSERLLDVWLDTNKISYTEIGVMFMENINWFVKGGNFLKRKFFKTKAAQGNE